MKKKIKKAEFNDGWCFAVVNGRLAEIHFMKKYGIWGHGYVKREEFNKREQKMINSDIKRCQFTYRNNSYFDKILRTWQKAPDIKKVFPEAKKTKTLSEIKESLCL